MGPRRSGFIFSATVLLALIPHLQAAAAEEYFVSSDGNDLASGSESAPWASFRHALSQLEPGDVLTARGGTYEEEVRSPTLSSGTRANPITVRAYGGERPVIKGLYEFFKRVESSRFTPPQILLRIYGGPAEGESLDRFFGDWSASVQHQGWMMGRAVLEESPDIEEVSFRLPNQHHLAFDLERFGLKDRGIVFQPVSEPYGDIRFTMTR
jgi:hypothetical protein